MAERLKGIVSEALHHNTKSDVKTDMHQIEGIIEAFDEKFRNQAKLFDERLVQGLNQVEKKRKGFEEAIEIKIKLEFEFLRKCLTEVIEKVASKSESQVHELRKEVDTINSNFSIMTMEVAEVTDHLESVDAEQKRGMCLLDTDLKVWDNVIGLLRVIAISLRK